MRIRADHGEITVLRSVLSVEAPWSASVHLSAPTSVHDRATYWQRCAYLVCHTAITFSVSVLC